MLDWTTSFLSDETIIRREGKCVKSFLSRRYMWMLHGTLSYILRGRKKPRRRGRGYLTRTNLRRQLPKTSRSTQTDLHKCNRHSSFYDTENTAWLAEVILFVEDFNPKGLRESEKPYPWTRRGTIPLMATPAHWQLASGADRQTLNASSGRLSLSGFLISGILMSFLGTILPAWGYHLKEDFEEVGYYFLSLNLGFLLSVGVAHLLLPRKGVKFTLVLANALACVAFLYMAASPAATPVAWRLFGLLSIGLSAGLLNGGIFQAISPLYQQDRAATVNLAGMMFGLGCLLTAILMAGTYYVYTVPSILILFAVLPGFYAGIYGKAKLGRELVVHSMPLASVLRDFRNAGAVLFSLLLFFQFGNEWSIAGWLPLFLIRRLGISPEASLFMLAFFWLALLVGRIAAQVILKRMSHGALLIGSILSALLGTVVLASTNNQFGAVMGILFIGAGYASIYPLVVEKIRYRFPYYHPGFYNGIFSFAITGGLLAPWTLGYFTAAWGIQAVMIVPLFGTCMVFLLVLLIMLEAKLSGLAQIKKAGS
jgi:FHS family glucose/mannose:H+ symporter-like MFS transporter